MLSLKDQVTSSPAADNWEAVCVPWCFADNATGSWVLLQQLLALDLRSSPPAVLRVGPKPGNRTTTGGSSSSGSSRSGNAGSNSGDAGRAVAPMAAFDVALHTYGNDLLMTCAGGWSSTPLQTHPLQLDESGLRRWFALHRLPSLLPRLAAAANRAAATLAELAVAEQLGDPVPPEAYEDAMSILPDVWGSMVRQQLYVSGLSAEALATAAAATFQDGDQAGGRTGGSNGTSNSTTVTLWNAAAGGVPLQLGPAWDWQHVLDGSALGDSDLPFVRQARWLLLGSRVVMHGGVQGWQDAAKVSRRIHVVDMARMAVAWQDVAAKPPYYEGGIQTASLRTMLLVNPPARDVDLVMAVAPSIAGSSGVMGILGDARAVTAASPAPELPDPHLVFFGLMDVFAGQEPDFGTMYRTSVVRQRVTAACRVPQHVAAGSGGGGGGSGGGVLQPDADCFVVSAAPDQLLPSRRDKYGAVGMVYTFQGRLRAGDMLCGALPCTQACSVRSHHPKPVTRSDVCRKRHGGGVFPHH